jgi:transaldolase
MVKTAHQVAGFTTNPSLVRASGTTDYEVFGQTAASWFPNHAISFEVIADDLPTMREQAYKIASWGNSEQVYKIASWGNNVYVKIPVMTTTGESTADLVHELSCGGVHVNVTAVFTTGQAQEMMDALYGGVDSIVSVFAGRIADAGVDPTPIVSTIIGRSIHFPGVRVLWASTRETYNVKQASQCGCHIITLSPALIAKLPLVGKDLEAFSLETVVQFRDDALAARLTL